MGINYYKTCDRCGQVLMESGDKDYEDYCTVAVRWVRKGKQYRMPTLYMCKNCIQESNIPMIQIEKGVKHE